jgi:glutaredoxin
MKSLSRNLLIGTVVIAIANLIPTSAQAATTCKVATRDRSNLTVYNAPNGKSVNELLFGREVNIQDSTRDRQGQTWVKVASNYNGEYRRWGWVPKKYLDCGGNQDISLIVYGRPGCSRTQSMRQQLSQQGVPYRFKDVDNSSENQEMWSRVRSSNLNRNNVILPIIYIKSNRPLVLMTTNGNQVISEFRSRR